MGIRVLCQLGIDQSDCVLCRTGRVTADEDLAGGSLALGQVVVARRQLGHLPLGTDDPRVLSRRC